MGFQYSVREKCDCHWYYWEYEEYDHHSKFERAPFNLINSNVELVPITWNKYPVLDEYANITEILHNVEHHDYHVKNDEAKIQWICKAHQKHREKYFSDT